MRKLWMSIAWLVALAAVVFDGTRGSVVHEMRGTVVEWQEGSSLTLVNEQTDPGGVRIDTRATEYDDDRGAIRTGVRVAVSYKFIGERFPVAVRMRVLDRQ